MATRKLARATNLSRDWFAPVDEMTSRDEFVSGLAARGFVPAGDGTWHGPVRVPDGSGGERDIEHEVALPEDFPFTGPKVRPVCPLPGPQWHMEHSGHLCLYQTNPGSLRDWDDAEALFNRIAGWYAEHYAGWPSDTGDLDLDRYFPRKDSGTLVVYEDTLATLTGRRLEVSRLPGLPGVYTVKRGRGLAVDSNGHRRRDRRSKAGYWGACLDLGTLDKPVNDWRSISQRLDSGTRSALLRLAQELGQGLLLVRYARRLCLGYRVGAAALRISRPPSGAPELEALAVEDRTAAVANRRGWDWERLHQARVTVVGCGAIGSFLAENLVIAGVGNVTLVDGERLRFGNCARHLADESLVHANKAVAVKQMLLLRAQTAGCSIKAIANEITAHNAAQLIDGRDLIVDATANGRVLALLEAVADNISLSFVSVALYGAGAVARVDRLGKGTAPWERRLPPVVRSGPEGVPESGCGDPVSQTPPSSVVAAASLAARVIVDTLVHPRTRRMFRDSVVETLIAETADKEYGTIGLRQL